jgi:peptide/nickel transport system permease protein
MLQFVVRRLLLLIPTLIVISIIGFIVIQLPPGDYLTSYVTTLEAQGMVVDPAIIAQLKIQYGVDQPMYVQYWRWATNALKGQFGMSLQYNRPVKGLIGERLALTLALSLASLLLIWVIAFPVGIYSAIKQYSVGDYVATFVSFVGVGIPDFLLALIVMWFAFSKLHFNVGGLFSMDMDQAPWSMAKFQDLMKHIWVPMVVLGMGGTAGLIRIMRANLLDELRRPYVVAARARGLTETRLLMKYPVRVALNPFVSTVGWTLPGLVSGSTIVSVVLNLQTTGPLLLGALKAQDMYLAGDLIMLLGMLTIIGTLVSDLLLAWLDPRIRYE